MMAVRIEVSKTPSVHGLVGSRSVPVKVLDSKSGPVTWLDKIKAYYHTLIVMTSIVLAGLTYILTAEGVVPPEWSPYVNLAIIVLTPVFTLLKNNEQWVDNL